MSKEKSPAVHAGLIIAAATLPAIALSAFATPALAGETSIRIAVLNDQSGQFSDLSGKGSVVAAQMAVADFGGKVLGRPIEVLTADHQNKPDIGSSIARGWLERDNVDAIVDLPVSSVALAVQSITREKKRIQLTAGGLTPSLSGKDCSPYATQWVTDTYALAQGAGRGLVAAGRGSWYFITVDYVFGNALQADASDAVTKAGGSVVGAVRHPLNNSDFSSYLLQAQASKAKVIGLATAGGDLVNALKQANEFGIVAGGQNLAPLMTFITDVNSIGLERMQGAYVTSPFYWDLTPETRAWSKRFMEQRQGAAPTMVQAGVYSAVYHYLKAIQAAGTDNAEAVSAKMKEIPVNDFFTKDVMIRPDGRVPRDHYVFKVKTPAESKGPWDYYSLVATVKGADATRPISESDCPLVKPKT